MSSSLSTGTAWPFQPVPPYRALIEQAWPIWAIRATAFTYYRWRKEFGGLKSDQVKRLKDLGRENERLRKAVSDLTLEKLILKEAASGNF